MSGPEDVVFRMLDGLDSKGEYSTLKASFEINCTDDVIWANTGFPTAEGKESALATWDAFYSGFGLTGLRADILSWASRDDRVVTERVDHLFNKDGHVFATIPVAGTLIVRDGKISVWRDYFDPRPFLDGIIPGRWQGR